MIPGITASTRRLQSGGGGGGNILVVELPPFTINPQLDDMHVDFIGSFSYGNTYQLDGYFDPTEYLTPSQISAVVYDVFNINQWGLLLQSMFVGRNISHLSTTKPYPAEWYAAFLNVRISATPPSEFVGVVDKFGVTMAPAMNVFGGVSISLQPLDLDLPNSTINEVFWGWLGSASHRAFDSEREEWVPLGEFGLLEAEHVSRIQDNPSLFTLLEVSW